MLCDDAAVTDTLTNPAPTDGRLVVDLLDPEFYRRNPHDAWTWMRANEPVYRDERNGLWGITRHADVLDVERRSTVFRSGLGYRALWSPTEVNMIAQDDPRHRQQRMLVQPRLTKQSVSSRQEQVRDLTADILDEALAAGEEMEVIDALAGQLPARLTAQLLGFPESRWRDLKSWSRAVDAHRHARPRRAGLHRVHDGQHGVRRCTGRGRRGEDGATRATT